MANRIVTGDQYRELDGQLFELKRQLRQPGGYPHDPALLKGGLQALIEGRFAAAFSTSEIVIIAGKFVIADYFKVGGPGTLICAVGDNFREWFYGKVEEGEAMVPRLHHTLGKDTTDEDIIARIGGVEKAEVALAGIWRLMLCRKDRGLPNSLNLSGGNNVFYAKDKNKILRQVSITWNMWSDGRMIFWDSIGPASRYYWKVGATDIETGHCGTGSHVFALPVNS